MARVAEYEALVAATRAWLDPLLAALPMADDLRRAYATSRELDATAGWLHGRTADHRFRRAEIDPYAQLKAAFTEALRLLERQRMTKGIATVPRPPA